MQHNVLILDWIAIHSLLRVEFSELNIFCEIFHTIIFRVIYPLKAVILGGSPFSVCAEDAPHPDLSQIRGNSLLAVCYGAQYLAHFSGGE
jgi:GMP synthase (glutamine-hydrolysing)